MQTGSMEIQKCKNLTLTTDQKRINPHQHSPRNQMWAVI